jgi:hypothetical protein
MARQVTITLDDDLAAQLEEEARRTGTPLEQAVAGAVRRAVVAPAPFRVRTFNMGKPLIDLECTGRALEELDHLDAVERSKRSDES